jgi:hypothetical protein
VQGASATGALRSPDRLGWWQHRLLFGPRITRVNRALIERVRAWRPNVVLMYLGHHYRPETVRALRALSFVTLFHSDDPLGPRRLHPRYRLVRRALRHYHGAHFYRQATTDDARARGMAHVATLLDFYRPWEDYPRPGEPQHEAVFIGHFEAGFRVDCLSAAARAGLPVRVYSHEPNWQRGLAADVKRVVGPGRGLYGDAYREKLSRAKVSLCFFSRWNRDVYTRRVFEVPACGGFLLCERSDFMQTLYAEGREAAYFGSPEELVDKLRYYLEHEAERTRIAAAGRARVLSGGHDINSRLRDWADTVSAWIEQREDM